MQQITAHALLSPAFGGCLFLLFSLAPDWDQQGGQNRSPRDPEIQEEGFVSRK